jgi:nucleotide-binding universal stress UspA family protein
MNRIQFIGNTLFVPFFLMSVGMLINPKILVSEPRSLLVAAVMIAAEVVSKFIAAWGPGRLFGLQFPSIMVVFGLSVAQAASTLAAITVAYQIQLVDQLTVNGVIAMILFTCIASPWITARWGQGMKPEVASPLTRKKQQLGDRILLPVSNPSTEDNLLHLALILAKTSQGTLLPLHILSDRQGEISQDAKMQQDQLLAKAATIAHAAVTAVEPIGRVDDSVDRGILRSVLERNANLIVCGWKGYSTYQENFFGSVIDNVVRRTTVPVLIARFTHPIETTKRVFLAFTELETSSSQFQQALTLAQTLTVELKANLQLLQVISSSRRAVRNLTGSVLDSDIPIRRVQGNFVTQVSKMLKLDDLLILTVGTHSERWGMSAVGVEPEAIARSHTAISTIVVHFPHPS